MRKAVILLSFTMLGLVPALAQNPADSIISQVRAQWVTSYQTKDLAAMTALYADDAVSLTSSGEIVGKDRIAANFKGQFDSPSTLTVRLDSKRAEVSGDLVYDIGSYEVTISHPEGAVRSGSATLSGSAVIEGGSGQSKFRGVYLTVLRRQEGKWLIVASASSELTAK